MYDKSLADNSGRGGLTQEIFSRAQTLDLSAFILFVLSCVGSGLATGLITRPKSSTDRL
jgi:hypothetical protein